MEAAFGHLGLEPDEHVRIDPRYFRPTEADDLQGDPSKAPEQLGWAPKVSFDELVRMMVDHGLELAELIRKVVGFEGWVEKDESKPDGTPRKLLDVSKLGGLGWAASVTLREGLNRTYREFVEQHPGEVLAGGDEGSG